MPKRSNKFQRLITTIHACLENNKNTSIEESVYLIDKETGEKREVDILIRSTMADYSVILAIEVIDRSRKAGSGWVEEMSGKQKALSIDKIVLVSRSGFTKPALIKAKARGIETLTFDMAYFTDWGLAMQFQGEGIFQLINLSIECVAHVEGNKNWVPTPLESLVLIPENGKSKVRDVVSCVISNPKIKKAVLDHFDKKKEQDYYAIFNPPEGTFLELSKREKKSLIKLAIGLRLEFEST